MTPEEALQNYYDMCRSLVKAGWTLNDIEESDFNTLIEVVCSKRKKTKKIDLMDYMKLEKGVAMC